VTYTIAAPCGDVGDKSCIEECPVDCIYEGTRMLYIHPDECVCGPRQIIDHRQHGPALASGLPLRASSTTNRPKVAVSRPLSMSAP